ncbi:protein kinase domain-containing protein [Streptomyces sp. IBSNAI001]|uniref:protein kinase domain-containing protein n=1 Tax=Streptomyces sp. IBSNAI001 TaxID=3457499 RepID=UPI003FD482B2
MKPLGAADPVRIGPYALAGKLGAGGMGEVYLGRSAGGRTVAVKVVRTDLAHDQAFRDRFRREVAAARRVSGAFTAPVVDADTEAEIPWMATSFVVGLSLHAAVAEHGPLPEDALRMLTAGLAEALLSIHGAGVIHRDLKPANVLLALDGPHVIDFGIARATDGTVLTSTGAVIGSAPYMSPEQAVGQQLGPASDVFSLASTVAFAAGGASPFGDGAGAAVLFRVVHTEPDLTFVPASLRPLIRRCLSKDPRERPAPREVITYAELAERARPAQGWAGWLPEPVAADVLSVRSVLTALPTPAPTVPLTGPTEVFPGGPGSTGGPDGTGGRPSRRTLLLGLAGGTVAVAGGGTAWALLRDRGTSGGGTSGSGSKGTASRPSGDDVMDAKLAWQVRQSVAGTQVLTASGVVACVSVSQVTGFDASGGTKWTVKAQDHGLAFSSTGTTPRPVAGLHDGRLYVGLSVMPAVAPGDLSAATRTALLGFRVADGEDPRLITLTETSGMGVSAFCGVRDGRAHTVTMSSQGTGSAGFGLWAADLGSRRTAWYGKAQATPVFWALPATGGGMVYAGVDRVVALGGKGDVTWSKKMKATAMATAGPHLVLVDGAGVLSAREPGTGRQAWKAEGAVGASVRGDGIATDAKGTVLYALWSDKDGGLSLAALDCLTGERRWKVPLPADAKGSAYQGARLLCADGNVYRMGADGVVWAFNASNGEPRWKYSGWKGTDPTELAWSAGDGRLCLSRPGSSTVAALNANGA